MFVNETEDASECWVLKVNRSATTLPTCLRTWCGTHCNRATAHGVGINKQGLIDATSAKFRQRDSASCVTRSRSVRTFRCNIDSRRSFGTQLHDDRQCLNTKSFDIAAFYMKLYFTTSGRVQKIKEYITGNMRNTKSFGICIFCDICLLTVLECAIFVPIILRANHLHLMAISTLYV
jgi:hypothetical protein